MIGEWGREKDGYMYFLMREYILPQFLVLVPAQVHHQTLMRSETRHCLSPNRGILGLFCDEELFG